jgi:hypothetical protein
MGSSTAQSAGGGHTGTQRGAFKQPFSRQGPSRATSKIHICCAAQSPLRTGLVQQTVQIVARFAIAI